MARLTFQNKLGEMKHYVEYRLPVFPFQNKSASTSYQKVGSVLSATPPPHVPEVKREHPFLSRRADTKPAVLGNNRPAPTGSLSETQQNRDESLDFFLFHFE